MVTVNSALVALLLPSSGNHALSYGDTPRAGPGARRQSLTGFTRALEAALTGPAERIRARPGHLADELDAATRQVAHLAPPPGGLEGHIQPLLPTPAAAPLGATPASFASLSLDELVPALVRKIGWSCDAQRCAVRIELGAGALSGATLLVAAERGRVRVTLRARSGVELESWRERIVARLAARGLDAEVI